jgi:alpha-mannosidase
MALAKLDVRLPKICDACFAPRAPITQIEYFETDEVLTVEQAGRSKAFSPVAIGHVWGRPWATAWFRYRFTIPAEMAGRTVFVFLDDGGEGTCYLDGVPLQGLDANHREIRLVEQAKGGETFDLLVESVPQADVVRFRGQRRLERAEMGALVPEVWNLYHDLAVLSSLARHLPADSARRSRILYLVGRALDRFDYDTRDPNELGRAAKLCRETLRPLLDCRAAPSAQRFACIGHAHIDVLWLWPYRETVRKCAHTFSTALKLMGEYPEYLFAQSQPQLYQMARAQYPALYEKVRQSVTSGQWKPVGAMWVEPDCNLTGGESLVRQIMLGKDFFRREFGLEVREAWLPDSFGFCGSLPQILKQSGIDYFVTQKLNWGASVEFPYDTFWWEGIDGSRVFSHLPPTNNYNCRVNAEEMLQGERTYVEKDRAQTQIYIFGYGDGGGGPTRAMLEFLRRARDLEGLPRCQPMAPSDFFERLIAESDDFPVWVGELYYPYHRGTYTTQALAKLNNRRAETLLHDAEAWSAVAMAGCGLSYPTEPLRDAWRLLCLCQFHDVLPGSSVGQVNREAAAFHAQVGDKAEPALHEALDCLAGRIETGARPGRPLVVFNSLGWERSGPVLIEEPAIQRLRAMDAENRPMRVQKTRDGWLLWAEKVPPCGYKTFWYDEGTAVATAAPEDEPKATSRMLENRYYRIELDEAGEIRRFFDKETGRDVLAEGETGNQIRLFEDIPHNWDAWEIDADYRDKMWPVHDVQKIEVIEQGLVRAALRIQRQFGQSKLTQTIVVWADSRRVDFETEVDWHENHKLLKAAFPLAVRSLNATYEIAFGHIERPTHTNTVRDALQFEVPAHRWADLSENGYGVALLNDCKYGYDARRHVLSLTLLRSPKEPDPEADMGVHRFTYSLLPHADDFRQGGVIRHGYELNTPLLARPVQTARVGIGALVSQSFFSVDAPNVVIETIKQAEEGKGAIVRLYEAWGRRGRARLLTSLPFKHAERVNLMEERISGATLAGGVVELHFNPHEIVTVRLF